MLIYLVEKIKNISTITDIDYITIVSTFITMTTPRYRCSDCHLKYKFDEVKRNRHHASMACNYFTKKFRHKYTATHNNKGNPNILFYNCIGNYYYGQWANIINYHREYDKGLLPYQGGLFDMPSKFVDVMNLVDNLISENNTEKEQQSKIEKQRNGRRSSKC